MLARIKQLAAYGAASLLVVRVNVNSSSAENNSCLSNIYFTSKDSEHWLEESFVKMPFSPVFKGLVPQPGEVGNCWTNSLVSLFS